MAPDLEVVPKPPNPHSRRRTGSIGHTVLYLGTLPYLRIGGTSQGTVPSARIIH
jgi:hypothetical protein